MDYRRKRSEATKRGLMLAAEKLIAAKGIENVTIRQIVVAAGQKNESALQYHFRNREGLIDALRRARAADVRKKRAAMLEAQLRDSPELSLRQLADLMVRPMFELARTKPEFRRYVRAFSGELALAESSALSMVEKEEGGGASGGQVGALLRARLPHLGEAAYRRRMDAALRMIAAAMSHQAGQKSAFRGLQADLFLHSLLDALVGLLGAPESDATRDITRAMRETTMNSGVADAPSDEE